MTDTITDYTLTEEAKSIAEEIFDDIMGDKPTEDPQDYRDEMSDRVHETVDGHQWVIYYHYAHQLCANCNTDEGEAFVEDVGIGPDPTYDRFAAMIAYGELRARVEQALETLIDDYEPAEEEEEEDA